MKIEPLPLSRAGIPFNRPSLVGRELQYVEQAIAAGHLASGGPFTGRCERLLQERTGAPRVLLTHSCTAALELAALLCDLAPGDEVVMPSFTFVTTASAFALRGARPVFVDVRHDTLNLDERLVEAALGPRTRAVVAVHYGGVACDLGALGALSRRHGLRLVEDAAQALGASRDGRALGTVGDLGCWSFHETKNLTCGEGGALAINDPGLAERAIVLRDKGTDRAHFLAGAIDRYTWREVGSSFAPPELSAAFLLAQLERADEVLARRRALVARYLEGFVDLAERGVVELPTTPAGCVSNGHLFYLLVESEERRDALLASLGAAGVQAVFHFLPLHESPMGRRLGYRHGQLPVTESVSRRLVRLPVFKGLGDDEQERVIDCVRSLLMQARRPVATVATEPARLSQAAGRCGSER